MENEKKNLNEQEMEQVNGGVRPAKLDEKIPVARLAMKKFELIDVDLAQPVTASISEHDDAPQS